VETSAPDAHSASDERQSRREAIVETVPPGTRSGSLTPPEPPHLVDTVPPPSYEPRADVSPEQQADEAARNSRKGWWQRRFGGG
jgi:ribonuclease E